MRYHYRFYLIPVFLVISICANAQVGLRDTLQYKIVSADSSLNNRSAFFQWLWGHNRRTEWATPVQVPLLWLDSVYGGLKPYQRGGGNETKSLRLRSSTGKEYTLRSINKSREDVILPIFKNTFVEHIIKDGVSCSYPYGAFPVTIMQEHAGIYHAFPILVYVPSQKALDTFNTKFGNDLYLLEQRPDGDWSESGNMGNFKEYAATEDVIKDILENNTSHADQHAFIIARLFDMLIADWDRHEDNWRWGVAKSNGEIIYTPIPRDRDQAFYTHKGVLVDILLPAAGLGFMQNFTAKPGNMATLNMEERNMDRFFSNQLTLNDWINAARYLQTTLTDSVITKSVQQLPPEIFAISGNELIQKLIARRNELPAFATSYYLFISKEVEIAGTKQLEYVEVKKEQTQTTISVYQIRNNQKETNPYYKRTFVPAETKEIRIYGIGGSDQFKIEGQGTLPLIRIIGGPATDSFVQSGSRVHVYDDKSNSFQTQSAKLHLSSDSSIHAYKYESFEYSSRGFSPHLFHNRKDRVYIGINYDIKKHKWRRQPFASQHTLGVNYSVSQQSVSTFYSGLIPNIIHHWDLLLDVNYDAARWVNFYGMGNETISLAVDPAYYRLRSNEWMASIALRRTLGKIAVNTGVFYQRVNIKTDTGRYAYKLYPGNNQKIFSPNNFAGIRLSLAYASVNDSIVPVKGFTFYVNGIFANNFRLNDFFQTYLAKVQLFLPLSNKFSLAIKAGGATVAASNSSLQNPQSLQHAMLGGPESLRGYRTERFWGKTSFYNNNELRFITDLRSYILNAKAGLIIFFDDGRVWMPSEDSNKLHTSYGGGLLLAPFNRLSFTLTYGISEERKMIQFRFNSLF